MTRPWFLMPSLFLMVGCGQSDVADPTRAAKHSQRAASQSDSAPAGTSSPAGPAGPTGTASRTVSADATGVPAATDAGIEPILIVGSLQDGIPKPASAKTPSSVLNPVGPPSVRGAISSRSNETPISVATAVAAPKAKTPPIALPTKPATRAEDFVGRWELVTVDGGPPETKNLLYYRLTIDAGGGWYSEFEAGGALMGRVFRGDGSWKMADGGVDYTSGLLGKGRSEVLVDKDVLLLKPDFSLRPAGKEVASLFRRIPLQVGLPGADPKTNTDGKYFDFPKDGLSVRCPVGFEHNESYDLFPGFLREGTSAALIVFGGYPLSIAEFLGDHEKPDFWKSRFAWSEARLVSREDVRIDGRNAVLLLVEDRLPFGLAKHLVLLVDVDLDEKIKTTAVIAQVPVSLEALLLERMKADLLATKLTPREKK